MHESVARHAAPGGEVFGQAGVGAVDEQMRAGGELRQAELQLDDDLAAAEVTRVEARRG